MRFVGHSFERISVISTKDLEGLIRVPDELNHLSDDQLILECKFQEGKIIHKGKKSAKEMKIALVSNFKQACGISTYAEALWQRIIPLVGDVRLFIEENDNPTSDISSLENLKFDKDQVLPCWKRGQSLSKLSKAIQEYQPDIVWIQHEFGLWSHAGHWLSFLTQISNFRTIVTMHSVFHHQDKTVLEAAMPEIVVHLEGARQVLLNEKGISRKISLIPHGCNTPSTAGKLWNIYRTDKTIVQFGFLFKYKGWETSLRAVAHLKKQFPDVFFTGLCSESQFGKAEHQLYYDRLLELIRELGIEENVALVRGFQSDQVLDSYLRTNQIALLPYVSAPGHEVFGASGAARLSMEKQIPVVSSSIPHFSDLPTIKADSDEEMAAKISELFLDWKLRRKQIDLQNKHLFEFSWEKMADKYVELFEQ